MAALSCVAGSLTNLKRLWLNYNQIGDAGIQALSDVIDTSLENLTALYVDHNRISEPGWAPFEAALARRASTSLRRLIVDD